VFSLNFLCRSLNPTQNPRHSKAKIHKQTSYFTGFFVTKTQYLHPQRHKKILKKLV